MALIMQTMLVDLAVSMTEFKKNPAAVLRQAAGRPVAVLNHNEVDVYLLTPTLLEALLDEIGGSQPGTRRQRLETLLARTGQGQTELGTIPP